MRIGVFFPSIEHGPVDEMVARAGRMAAAGTGADRDRTLEHLAKLAST